MRKRAHELHRVTAELRQRTGHPFRVIEDCTGEYKGTARYRYCVALRDSRLTVWTTSPNQLAAEIEQRFRFTTPYKGA